MRAILGICLSVAISAGAMAQMGELSAKKKEYVTIAETPQITVAPGRSATAEIRFRVNPGYHINSHHPGSELLIPTAIKISSSEKIKIGKINYPAGGELALPFDPKEKLSVYTGDVSVKVPISVARNAKPGEYKLKGELHYQACSDNSCFPPRSVPVEVPVKVE